MDALDPGGGGAPKAYQVVPAPTKSISTMREASPGVCHDLLQMHG